MSLLWKQYESILCLKLEQQRNNCDKYQTMKFWKQDYLLFPGTQEACKFIFVE